MDSLKPCPFCGSKNLDFNKSKEKQWYYVYCIECGCAPFLCSSYEEAIEKWDKRVEVKI